jgi:mRNA interferase MazF
MNFDPQAGREQAGRREAYVLSPRKYNRVAGLCIVCPITTQVKGYPYEVALPAAHKAHGVVLADQVKSLSWRMRQTDFFTSCPEIAGEIVAKIETLMPI